MARRGENIYRRKDGRWEGRYIKARNSLGQAIYGYIYSRSYNEVKEKLIKAKNECGGLLLTENMHMKLSEIALQWLEATKNNCKQSTHVKYRNTIVKHILPKLGEHQLYRIDTKVINAFCDYKLQNCGHPRVSAFCV